ncbi:hypothetical protein M3Y96_00185200 [Aphelenchoides besseyi]|nr:hypothetical protein M3Y96_00185200 [Aphelenchoides besseyi]
MDGDENTFLQLRKEQLDRFSKSSERKKLNSPKEVDANKKSGRLNRDYDSSKLYLGFEIKCKTGERYKVVSQIAENVYAVRQKTTSTLYAMKVEMFNRLSDIKQLKRDAFLLMDVLKHHERYSRHFLRLHNKGRVNGLCNYVIMTFGDYNLNDLRINLLSGCDFSRPNAARLAMQTFQAVHDLHALGFIHRDISPTKFIFGLDNPQIVYMIGFSLSYHFEQHYETKPSVSPRRLPKLSNRSFRSRSYHRNKEINRKDDLESWVYLSFNLFGRRLLPWDEQSTDLNMFINKERLFGDGFEECYKFVPRQFLLIIHNLDKVGDTDRPNYTYIGMLLITMKEQIKFHFRGPFDWQKAGHTSKNTYDVDFDKDETLTLDAKDEKRRVVRGVSGEESYIELFPNEAEDLEEDGREAIAQSMPPINAKKPQIVQIRKPKKPKQSVQKYRKDQRLEEEIPENESLMNKRLHKSIHRPKTPYAFSPITPTKSPQVVPSNNQLLMQMEEIKRQNAEMNAKLDALTVENKPSARKKKMEKEEDEEEEESQPLQKTAKNQFSAATQNESKSNAPST